MSWCSGSAIYWQNCITKPNGVTLKKFNHFSLDIFAQYFCSEHDLYSPLDPSSSIISSTFMFSRKSCWISRSWSWFAPKNHTNSSGDIIKSSFGLSSAFEMENRISSRNPFRTNFGNKNQIDSIHSSDWNKKNKNNIYRLQSYRQK